MKLTGLKQLVETFYGLAGPENYTTSYDTPQFGKDAPYYDRKISWGTDELYGVDQKGKFGLKVSPEKRKVPKDESTKLGLSPQFMAKYGPQSQQQTTIQNVQF